jgi:hypothetical protein
LLLRKSRAPQTDRIHSPDTRWVSVSNEERQHILNDFGFATDHCEPTHSDELMSTDVVGQEDVILDMDVAG